MTKVESLPHTKISYSFLVGLLYDIVNTTFLFNTAYQKINPKSAKEIGQSGWINFPSFWVGKHYLIGEVSHGPYELKRGRYNSNVFPKIKEITDLEIQAGMHYSNDYFQRMVVQISIDTKSKVPLRDLGPYDRINLAEHYRTLPGEGSSQWIKRNGIRIFSLLIALFFGMLTALLVVLIEALGLFPILTEPFSSFGLFALGNIDLYDLLGPAGAIVVAYYAGSFFFKTLEAPLLSTFEKRFSERLLYDLPTKETERFDFNYARDDEKRIEEIVGDFMKRSFIFKRKKTTPYYLQADRVTHIEETFRIGVKKRHQIILHYIGHSYKGTLKQKFSLQPNLGYFADRFLEINLGELGRQNQIWLKEARYMDIGRYNLKFNFKPMTLVVSKGHAILQPELTPDGKYLIEGVVAMNPEFFREIKRKEKGIHIKSVVKGDPFHLIFDPEQRSWEIQID
ncbi:MAG: hypothetical protein ACFFBD_24765 [Candidatus Hodarchaeota archaeon]